MARTTLGIIETMLESALRETDDPELTFKLRSALQLLVVLEQEHDIAREDVEDTEMEADIRDNLRRLGYLD